MARCGQGAVPLLLLPEPDVALCASAAVLNAAMLSAAMFNAAIRNASPVRRIANSADRDDSDDLNTLASAAHDGRCYDGFGQWHGEGVIAINAVGIGFLLHPVVLA